MIYLTHLNKYSFNNFLGKMSNIYFNNYDKTKMQSVEVRYHDEQLGGVIIMTNYRTAGGWERGRPGHRNNFRRTEIEISHQWRELI